MNKSTIQFFFVRIPLLLTLLLYCSIFVSAQCVSGVSIISIPRNIGCSFGTGGDADWDGAVGGTISDPGGSSSSFTVTWSTTGTFRLKRTFPNGCTGTPLYSTYYTINASPAAPSSSEVNQQAGCGQVTLNYTGGVSTTFWQKSGIGTDETYQTTRTVSTAATYYARIKNNATGCWSPATALTVSSIPSIPVGGTLAPSNLNYYGTVNTTLQLSGSTGSVKEYRYTENGGGQQVIPGTTTSLNVSFTNTSSSAVAHTYWAVVTQNGCEVNSATSTITLQGLPAYTMTACVGTTTSHNITAATSCQGGSATFAVGTGGVISEPIINGGFSVTWTTPGTYALKRTFPSPCNNEILSSDVVLVLPQPASPSVSELNQTPGCGSVGLNYTGGASTFWQTSAGGVDPAYQTSRMVTSPGTYYARSRSANGCWSPATALTVSSIPGAPVGGTLLGGGNYYGTANVNLTLNANNGNVQEYRYKENSGSEVVVANTTTTLPVSFSNAKSTMVSREYWAVVMLSGCQVNSASTTLTLSGLPAPSLTVCVGQTTQHSITRSTSCTGSNATFAVGSGGTISDLGGTTSNFSVTWTTPGTYTLKRSFPACNNDIVGETVLVNSIPQAPSTPIILSNCNYITLGYSGSPMAGEEWHWQGQNINGGLINNQVNFTVEFAGTYYLQSRSVNGCWGSLVSIAIKPSDFIWSGLPLIDYNCSKDGLTIVLITDNPGDRWFSSFTSTTSLSSTNNLTVLLNPTTIYLERTISTVCTYRTPYEIDFTLGLNCGSFQNSIKQIKPLEPVNQVSLTVIVNESYQYFDGLGRGMQSVVIKGSPLGMDIIQPMVYDVNGREPVKYLPYTSGNDGLFKTNFKPREDVEYATSSSPQYQFYQSTSKVAIDANPYSQSIFEPSPLNRITEQGAPGSAWQPGTGNTIKKFYELNQTNEVYLLTYSPTDGRIILNTDPAQMFYQAKQLSANRTQDERQNNVIEYVDKLGHTILKRVQVVSGTPSTTDSNRDTNYASTYYIYDDLGNLVVVLPPEAVKKFAQ